MNWTELNWTKLNWTKLPNGTALHRTALHWTWSYLYCCQPTLGVASSLRPPSPPGSMNGGETRPGAKEQQSPPCQQVPARRSWPASLTNLSSWPTVYTTKLAILIAQLLPTLMLVSYCAREHLPGYSRARSFGPLLIQGNIEYSLSYWSPGH